MLEEERALELAGHEAGAEDGVGALVEEERDHREQVGGMVFEVGIVDDAEFAFRARDRRAHGAAFALVRSWRWNSQAIFPGGSAATDSRNAASMAGYRRASSRPPR